MAASSGKRCKVLEFAFARPKKRKHKSLTKASLNRAEKLSKYTHCSNGWKSYLEKKTPTRPGLTASQGVGNN